MAILNLWRLLIAYPVADASPAALTIRVVSHICNGKARKGFDAILGSCGMSRLSVGINKDTSRLYVKRRTCHRKYIAALLLIPPWFP